MKIQSVLNAVIGLTLVCSGPLGCSSAVDAAPPAANGEGVAVIELFTSEGCSSCPPADAAFGRIAAEAKEKHLRVFPIAFHVDYWDGLGWKDRFSLAAATERQSAYARAMKSDEVYTPQAIVNGTKEFNGSSENRLGQEIADALKQPAAARVTLRDGRRDRRSVSVHFSVDGVDAPSTLRVVAVTGDETTEVKRGENGGRRLKHTNVALAIEGRAVNGRGEGDVTLRLPDDAEPATLIAFVQRDSDQRITAASATALIKAPAPPAGLGVIKY